MKKTKSSSNCGAKIFFLFDSAVLQTLQNCSFVDDDRQEYRVFNSNFSRILLSYE